MNARTYVRFPMPLSSDRMAWLEVPRDMTRQEAERIAAIIATLGITDVPKDPA